MKTVVFTVATDIFKDYAVMTHNSFLKFHPDIEHRIIHADTVLGHLGMKNFVNTAIKLHEEFDLVVSLHADCIVCGPLDEILAGDFDVAASLNDGNVSGQKIHLLDIKPEDYLTCAVVATTNHQFWAHWNTLNERYISNFPFADNDTFNIAFYYGNYRYKVLDRDNVFYGTSCVRNWKDFRVEGDVVRCNDRVVKVMHRAGGSNEVSLGVKEQSYWEVGFPPDVCRRFDYLTK